MVNSRRELFLVTRYFSFENHGNRIVLASQEDAEDRNSRASCAIESPLSAIAFSLEYSIAADCLMCFAIYHFCSSGLGSKKSKNSGMRSIVVRYNVRRYKSIDMRNGNSDEK